MKSFQKGNKVLQIVNGNKDRNQRLLSINASSIQPTNPLNFSLHRLLASQSYDFINENLRAINTIVRFDK